MTHQKQVIYKLFCRDPSVRECYVGSTKHIWKRMQSHKHSCKNQSRSIQHVHTFINEHGGWSNWNMEILEILPFGWLEDEVRIREQAFILQEHATLNIAPATICTMKSSASSKTSSLYVNESKTFIPCVLATMNTGDRWIYLSNMQNCRMNTSQKDNVLYIHPVI